MTMREAERVAPLDVRHGAEARARIAKRYDRQAQLGRGATGTVYRAYDRLHRRLVALKTSLLDAEPPGDDPLTSQPLRTAGLLAGEFKLLSSLRHPNVVTCMEYGLDASERPFFTMDLQRDALPLREAARDLPHGAKVDLLVQLLHALAYVHRRGLVHRDVKSDNVLCTRGVVKLIDFGLAAPAGRKEDAPVGTLAYSAPEVVRGAPASAAGDLFAVGVVAYEIFAGRHPFDTRSSATLLQGLFHGQLDFAAIEPRVAAVVRRLLARDAKERFAGALEVVTAMTDAASRSLPLETVSTREAFLQGTELVGRDAELDRLCRAIPVHGAEGKAVVVTGESGVGKSRLLEELGMHAMVRGARVLRGQALPSGGRPYEPWRAVMRALALVGGPSALEESVLAGVVPDVAAVLERAVPAAPELDSEATHLRVVRVLEAMLRRFPEPLLVVLEDMQWAGAESLALFARVHALAANRPISIVASVRADATPVADELARAEVIALDRLTAGSVARLCATTIGAGYDESRGRPLAELVFEQSGGNAFAVLEVVRTLADEAGGLERVTALASPERALAGRIERLSDRRVERLSESDRAILRTAAVAGRELDLDLLSAIHPDADVGACAARAVDAAVLASVQGRWWFAHDKLRDAVIEAMPDVERRRLHQGVGEALVRIAPDDAPTLAYHFRAAGDVAREADYAARAGEQFLRSGAYRDAIGHLERALALGDGGGLPRARLERQLGESLFRCGKLPEAKRALASALVALGRPLPESKLELARAMVVEASAQAALRARRAKAPRRDPSLEEAILVYTQLSRLAHHLNDEPLVLYVTLSALNLAERGGIDGHHARLAAVFGAVMGLAPVHKWARFYFKAARELGARIDDESLRAFILAHQGYYEAGIGAWKASAAHLEESIELYDRVGDVRLAEESVSILAYALFFEGDRARSLELYERLERSGEERGDTQIVSWGVTNRLKVMIALGRHAAIDDAMLARADALLVDGITRAVHAGVLVELALARGDLAGARRAAEAARSQLEKSPPRSFMACSAYASSAEALLACARKDPRDGALRASAEHATRALGSIARVFPIAEPARLRAAGVLEALRGRTSKARALLERSATLADDRDQPYDADRARAALGDLRGG